MFGKRIKGPEYIWGRGHRGRTLGLVGQVGCGQRGRSHYSQSDTRAIKNGAGFEFTNWRKNFNFKKIKFLKKIDICDQMNLQDEPHQVYG